MTIITAPTKEELIAKLDARPDCQIVRIIAKRGDYSAQIIERKADAD